MWSPDGLFSELQLNTVKSWPVNSLRLPAETLDTQTSVFWPCWSVDHHQTTNCSIALKQRFKCYLFTTSERGHRVPFKIKQKSNVTVLLDAFILCLLNIRILVHSVYFTASVNSMEMGHTALVMTFKHSKVLDIQPSRNTPFLITTKLIKNIYFKSWADSWPAFSSMSSNNSSRHRYVAPIRCLHSSDQASLYRPNKSSCMQPSAFICFTTAPLLHHFLCTHTPPSCWRALLSLCFTAVHICTHMYCIYIYI